jgi:hypothetical protein
LWEISIDTFPLLNGARVSAVNQAAPKLSRLREAAEAEEWRAMSAGDGISAPRPPRVLLASRLRERDGRRTALRNVKRNVEVPGKLSSGTKRARPRCPQNYL